MCAPKSQWGEVQSCSTQIQNPAGGKQAAAVTNRRHTGGERKVRKAKAGAHQRRFHNDKEDHTGRRIGEVEEKGKNGLEKVWRGNTWLLWFREKGGKGRGEPSCRGGGEKREVQH